MLVPKAQAATKTFTMITKEEASHLTGAKIAMMATVFCAASLLLLQGLHASNGTAASALTSGSQSSSAASSGGSQNQSSSATAPPAQASSSGGTNPGQKTSKPSSAKVASGPLLSSEPYASVAYRIYPGTMSSAAQTAIAGFTFRFSQAGSGKEKVTAYAYGQSTPIASSVFAGTDKLYFIETSLGDDAAQADLNGGDDALVLTDAAGHIVRG